MEDFRTRALIKLYRKSKSKRALDVLIKNHTAAIHSVIKNFSTKNFSYHEMLSLSHNILLTVIDDFDLRYKIKFNTYFMNILKFRIIDELRKHLHNIYHFDDNISYNSHPCSTSDVQINFENEELKKNLIEAITKLPKDQQIIVAYIYEGGSQKDLANQTGFSQSYINQLYKKGLSKLKQMLIV